MGNTVGIGATYFDKASSLVQATRLYMDPLKETLQPLYVEAEGAAGLPAYDAYTTSFALWLHNNGRYKNNSDLLLFNQMKTFRAAPQAVAERFSTFLGERRHIGTWPGANLFFWGQVCADIIKFEDALTEVHTALQTNDRRRGAQAGQDIRTLREAFNEYFSSYSTELGSVQKALVGPDFRDQLNLHKSLGLAAIGWLLSFKVLQHANNAETYETALAHHRSLHHLLATMFPRAASHLPHTTVEHSGDDILTVDPVHLGIFTLDLLRMAAASPAKKAHTVSITTDSFASTLEVRSSLPLFRSTLQRSDDHRMRVNFGVDRVNRAGRWVVDPSSAGLQTSGITVQFPAPDATTYSLAAAARAVMPVSVGMLF